MKQNSINKLSRELINMLYQYDDLKDFFDHMDEEDRHEFIENLQDILYDWEGSYYDDNTDT